MKTQLPFHGALLGLPLLGLVLGCPRYELPTPPPLSTPTPTVFVALTATSTQTPLVPTATSTDTPVPPTATATPTPTMTLTASLTSTATETLTLTPLPPLTSTPTGSPTDTPTITPTPTSTATSTSTPVATCTFVPFGGTSTANGSVTLLPGASWGNWMILSGPWVTQTMIATFAQAGAVVRVGIYDDTGTTYPANLLSVSSPQTVSSGPNTFTIPPVTILNGVTYWLALGVDPASPLSAAVSWESASGIHAFSPSDLPSPFSGAVTAGGSLTLIARMNCP